MFMVNPYFRRILPDDPYSVRILTQTKSSPNFRTNVRSRGLAELFGFSFASASSICLALDRVATFRGIFAVSQDLSAMASQARGNTNGNSRRKTPSRTRNPRLVWQWQLPSKARDKIEAPPIGIVQANENFAEEETNRCLNIGTNGTIHFDSIPDADAITFRPRS